MHTLYCCAETQFVTVNYEQTKIHLDRMTYICVGRLGYDWFWLWNSTLKDYLINIRTSDINWLLRTKIVWNFIQNEVQEH